ncbi:MAG: alpha,alpha-trehalose-phosphate synthase (UDP-forming) [Acidobacteriota bacterium]
MGRLVIVSNRVMLPGARPGRAGGLAIALRDALRVRGGLWFGWSGETAETTSTAPRVAHSGRIQYATVDLGTADHERYYNGFSNGTLWPLLHYRLGLIEFRREDLEAYLRVNEAFAEALLRLLRPDDSIWIHDYHLIPLAASLRSRGVAGRIGLFLHTPFPPPSVFAALPRCEILVNAFAAYDLIGLQTESDRVHLRGVIARHRDAAITPEGDVDLGARRLLVRALPIGIDARAVADMAESMSRGPEARRLTDSLAGRDLIIGVDRLDYSKGLPQRFEAYERLLADFPEHRSNVTFMQIAPVSRGEVRQYRELRRDLDRRAGRINGKFAEFDWIPLRYLNRGFGRHVLAGFYRRARVGLVTPLRDGMNLVAKEWVAAQDPENPGALVLSRFAGAAHELADALLVNPLDADAMAEALHRALTLSHFERLERWQSMMQAVAGNTAAVWQGAFLSLLEDAAATVPA